jgi:hypothetical protein
MSLRAARRPPLRRSQPHHFNPLWHVKGSLVASLRRRGRTVETRPGWFLRVPNRERHAPTPRDRPS